jgi:hypothetical protein
MIRSRRMRDTRHGALMGGKWFGVKASRKEAIGKNVCAGGKMILESLRRYRLG